ncbi:hypothetical protein PIB30_086364 [Stylosanthes scabra]|uniref:Uncharacterized protein n=1 Tax=Stylosanthes scabra TaxID=79078 RepID=A0ABU6ZRQ8_9FABA|nr:hypothetical protein [Stylosanthes scabra]
MLPVSFGAGRSGSPPTPPPRDSSPDEPRQRDRSPRLEIRKPMSRSLRFTAPEYRSFIRAQPPPEPAPVIDISSDDDTEDSVGTKSGPSSDSSSGLYSTSTSSSDVTSGCSYDSTDHSISSSSDVTFDSDPRSPWPSPSVSSGSYASENDLLDRYFAETFPPRIVIVEDLLGLRSPMRGGGKNEYTAMKLTYLRAHVRQTPSEAPDDVLRQYARCYILMMGVCCA